MRVMRSRERSARRWRTSRRLRTLVLACFELLISLSAVPVQATHLSCSAPPGSYCPAGTFGTTDPCPAGFFCAGGGNTKVACPPGTFSRKVGAIWADTCQPCQSAAGSHCPAGCPTEKGITCPPGTFSNTSATSSCAQCEPGTFVNATGATACLLCAAAAMSAENASACICGSGFEGDGYVRCSACVPGKATSPAAGTCLECEPGHYSSASAATGCNICEAGTFVNATGATACL